MRHARRNSGDFNRGPIVRALIRVGAEVLDLNGQGGGCADYLVGFCGRVAFLEVKNPATAYGQAGLTERQQKFRARWAAIPFHVVTSPEEALRAIGVSPG